MANATVTHKFTSNLTDGPDATQVQPSHWNDAHKMTVPSSLVGASGVIVGTDVSGELVLSGVKATAASQVFRRNAGNTAYEFAGRDGFDVFAADFNFANITGNVNLTASISNSVTIAPVPLGVNGSNQNYYIFIFDGAKSEAVKVTGGTAISGAASGTLLFVPLQNHTAGQWSLQPIAGGILEAYWSLGGIGVIHLRQDSTIQILGPIIFSIKSGGSIVIKGENQYYIQMVRNETYYLNGDLFTFTDGVLAQFQDFGINCGSTTASGSFIKGKGTATPAGQLICYNLLVQEGAGTSIMFDGVASSDLVNVVWQKAAGNNLEAVNFISSTGTIFNNNAIISRCRFGYNEKMTVGIDLQSIDGVQICDCMWGGPISYANIRIGATSGQAVVNVYITNNFFDAAAGCAIRIVGTLGTMGAILISDNHIRGQYDSGQAVYAGQEAGIDLGQSALTNATDVTIVNNEFSSWRTAGLKFGIPQGALIPVWTIKNNIFVYNNLGNLSIPDIFASGNVFGVTIDGNYCGNVSNGSPATSSGGFGATGNITNVTIINNDFHNVANSAIACQGMVNCNIQNNDLRSPALPINASGTIIDSIIAGNQGLNDRYITIASAAALTLPLNDTMAVTGSTNVTSFSNFWEGRRFTLLPTQAALIFTAGSTIGNTFNSVQNKPVNCICAGGKVYLS